LGTSSLDRRGHFLELGVDQYLRQPWASEELLLLWGKIAARAGEP
jgi:hypothetical protein